ncbi:isochorismatase family protein [Paenibacillus physcomitrellae]|uniref:Isochorismatase-like domain-containing protein n=1 Tax=Paenibacillus physcomitrellae TaxID=1619311 RepID=A0ABQ1FRG6_9BACL|nr:isochorismatase family protein [Paenibacillus physcomitrellae]GGA26126.1 hypothetical protein GCM10010917_08710 [Paenibacillus physcomitrellae]
MLVAIQEAAKLLGVSPTSLRRLEKDDIVKGYGIRVYYTPGGQRRYSTEEIEQYYLNRGFSGRFGFGDHPVLLVMDCNTAFTSKDSAMHGEWDKEIAHISELVDTAHKTGCPVIFSNSYFDPKDPALNLFLRKVPAMEALAHDPAEIQIDPRIKVRQTDRKIFTKYYTVYSDTDLLPLLRSFDCDTLILCGFSTSGAVRSMATETIQYAMRPIIPAEAVGDRDDLVHRNNLSDIDRKFGDVVKLREVLQYLQERKG